MTVAVANISKRFGSFTALDNVSLRAEPGEFLALLGPSGSGKTTLLRIMAGLEAPDAGIVTFDGVDVSDRTPAKRAVGFVFQHYALFRHMTVAQNIAFGLSVKPRRERWPQDRIDARVAELLNLVQLAHLGPRYPSQLSGGQRQRVALARALAVNPRILLLDEPFGALDAKVRKDLRRWLKRIHAEMGLTSVFVTHDQEEALDLADRVVVMNHGVIEQIDTPARVYDHPASAFVCDFLGDANRFDAVVNEGGVRIAGQLLTAPTEGDVRPGAAVAFVRPHEFDVVQSGDGIPVTLRRLSHAGAQAAIEAETADGVAIEVTVDHLPAWASTGGAAILAPKRLRVFPA